MEETHEPATRPRGRATVLVVDDDVLVVEIVTLALTGAGYCVLSATYGPKARVVADRHAGPIDLVIADATMIGMAGLEIIAALRDRRPGLRAVLASGGQAAIEREAATAGVRLLRKPFRLAVLLRVVDEVLVEQR